jgi:ParB-like chromosome segregation protein Spo0J
VRLQRRGGRKRIVAPDGSAIVPTSKPQPDGTLVKGLARAHRWQGMLDEGRFASVRELADAERVSLSYISRILRLTLLAPDIVERVMDGEPTAGLARLLEPFPIEWEKQREQFLVICTQRIDPQPRAPTRRLRPRGPQAERR